MSATKPRLAFFLPGLYDGGAERVVLNLATGIAHKGYPVDLVLARAEGAYLPQVPEGIRLVDLKARRVLSSAPALAAYIRREQPAALLSALFANVVALWARRMAGLPKRLLISEHNTLSSVVCNQRDLRWKIYPRLAGWFYPWADGIIAVSKAIAADLTHVTAIPQDRIRVVYNPVVTPDLLKKANEPIRHAWFQPGEPPVIVALGRLTAQKGLDVLIRAFAAVRQRRTAHLLILGDGALRPDLQALVHSLGLEADVSMPGFLQNPYPYMKRASILVQPSRWEGLPTVLIEALYLGTPIVATDCPGGTREILMNGQYGRIVPVDSPEALALAMEETLGKRTPQPPESWRPYESEFVMDRYLELLVGS